jgi:hypothetical protein
MSDKPEKSDTEKTKNDLAWERLFEKYPILEEINSRGIYKISAKVINEEREARLMTKFDHSVQLPYIFQQNNLSIQPDSRGTYVIGNFESYKKLPKKKSIEIQAFPCLDDIETLKADKIYSEFSALLYAYNSGIIDDLLDQKVKFTIAGRMSTGKFRYSIRSLLHNLCHEINVDNSQCEIDGGFEGEDILAIIEVKNQNVEDFLIRQLYYPYRLWTEKTTKQVIPIFLSYSNDIFNFYIYEFEDYKNYNSISFVEQKRYQIGLDEIEFEDITSLVDIIKIKPEPEGIPFPQANVFARVVDLLIQIHGFNPRLSQEDIAINYAFKLRQAEYYADAARYLGLLQKDDNKEQGIFYSMTEKGHNIMEKTTRNRNLALVECIIEKKLFNSTFKIYLEKGGRMNKHNRDLIRQILVNEQPKLSEKTIKRRSSTVFAWIKWIMELTQPSDNRIFNR